MTITDCSERVPRERYGNVQVQSFRKTPPLPDDGNAFIRLVTAKAIASLQHTRAHLIAQERWPHDQIVNRAASAPAMTSVTGWAKELVRTVVVQALAAMGP